MIEHLRYALSLIKYACEVLEEAELALTNFRDYCLEKRGIVHDSWLYCMTEWAWFIRKIRERVQPLSALLRKKLDRLESEGEATHPTPPGKREPRAREAGGRA